MCLFVINSDIHYKKPYFYLLLKIVFKKTMLNELYSFYK